MFNKDNLLFGLLLGAFAPIAGLLLLKVGKFNLFSFRETLQFMLNEPGYRTLSAGLSLSLLLNALFFTIFINRRKDQTAKGIFITTLFYGLLVLSVKTFL
jgi:hypothetical protein